MNVSHFAKICQVLTLLYQLICRGVANFGTRCICFAYTHLPPRPESPSTAQVPEVRGRLVEGGKLISNLVQCSRTRQIDGHAVVYIEDH